MTTPTTPVTPKLAPSVHDGLAVTSFVFAFFFAPLGFILGWVSVYTAGRDGRRASGLAAAAVVLGGLFTLIAVIVVIAAVHAASMAPPACDLSNPAYPYC
jgi:hypothetical protein